MKPLNLALGAALVAGALLLEPACGGGGDPGPDAGLDAGAGSGADGGGARPGVFTDPGAGLTWEDPPSATDVDHAGAVARCDDLVLGGFDDWRLPTVGELRSLVRGCAASEIGGACAIHEKTCLSGTCQDECYGCDYHMGPADGCYWPPGLRGECTTYWSSSLQEGFDAIAYDLSFDHASLRGTGTHNLQAVRCVRRSGGQ